MGDALVFVAVVLYGIYEFVKRQLMKAFMFYLVIFVAVALLIFERGNMEPFLAAVLAALAFGTLGGWFLLVTAIIVIITLVENDHEIWAFLGLVASVALLYHVKLSALGGFVIHHPGLTALYIIGYFAAGALYGVAKWSLYVTGMVEKYNEAKTTWLQNHKTTVPNTISTPEEALAFKSSLSTELHQSPKVSNHKGDILTWMTYWPFSGLWTLINDPVRRAFRAVYAQLSGFMQRISDHMFKGATADLALASAAEEAERARRDEEVAKRQAARDGVSYRR